MDEKILFDVIKERDLRQAENDELKARNVALRDLCVTLDSERMKLREALEMVEWRGIVCPWCKGLKVYPGAGHSPSCARQKALELCAERSEKADEAHT